MDKPLQEIVNELKKRNIRPSYQRLKILEYLMKERYHPTVEDIYFDLLKKIPTLSKSTIYNTLNLFIEKKLIKEVSMSKMIGVNEYGNIHFFYMLNFNRIVPLMRRLIIDWLP